MTLDEQAGKIGRLETTVAMSGEVDAQLCCDSTKSKGRSRAVLTRLFRRRAAARLVGVRAFANFDPALAGLPTSVPNTSIQIRSRLKRLVPLLLRDIGG